MTAAQALAGAAAALCALGLVLMVAALVPTGTPRRRASAHPRRWTWSAARWPLAGLAGVVGWTLTGWPAVGAGVAAAVIGLPVMARADSLAQSQIDRAEAVEEWARRTADVLAIGVGLEQAIQTSARTAPAPISLEVSTLSARIAARMPTEIALRHLADEVDDPTADLVVAALILASRRRGPGVARALGAIADSVGEEVAARRRIEADRAKPRTTARAVTAITLTIIAAGLLNRGYSEPYGTGLGQVVLTATLGFFAAALWWMHGMTKSSRPARILEAVTS
jgi:Flp pilus assembly protein TadB